jgi:hypothetical protein
MTEKETRTRELFGPTTPRRRSNDAVCRQLLHIALLHQNSARAAVWPREISHTS